MADSMPAELADYHVVYIGPLHWTLRHPWHCFVSVAKRQDPEAFATGFDFCMINEALHNLLSPPMPNGFYVVALRRPTINDEPILVFDEIADGLIP